MADRVAFFLEQSMEVAISHIAICKAGGIAVLPFYLFGDDALQYRLSGFDLLALASR